MARYQIIIAYDGTAFQGSQRQAAARTVQSVLEKALDAVGWRSGKLLLAGRTDSGVHARGQVAAVDLNWRHDSETLRDALNAHLPADMAVREVRTTRADFHPRYDACSRRYLYRLFCQPLRDPLRERYAWRVWPKVDGLQELADLWPGRHDFAAFGSPTRPHGSTIRTVQSAGWRQEGDEWLFQIRADAFLFRMVRRLTFVQVAVSQGRICKEQLATALEGQTPLPAGIAPACGLSLEEVVYAE